MLRSLTALIAAAALASSAAAEDASVPNALAQAVAATQAAKTAYSFDLDLASSDQNWRARFNPRTSPRLQLVEPNISTLENGARRAFERMSENMQGLSWCASEEMTRVADVRLLREDADTATYAFQPTRESIRGEQARAHAQRLRGEFVLTKAAPDLVRVRIFTPRSFSPMPLVNVERLNIEISCAAAPNGRRYAAETVSEVRGSAFGQAFNERSVQRMHGLRPTP